MPLDLNPTDRTTSAPTVELDADLIVAGHIATWWADSGQAHYRGPRGWASQVRRGSISVGNDTWVCGKEARDWQGKERVMGIRVTRHIEALNNGKEEESWWFPLSGLRNVKLVAEGLKLG